MKPLTQCIAEYFSTLISECEDKDKLSVRYLRESVLNFLETPNEINADEVYNSFFDAFRMRKNNFAFFDILDALRTYELQTSGLTDNQRDHFTHSVWVFLMGLGVFAGNQCYRTAFGEKSYVFLYRWGLVSLLHDIGYPIEITFNQLKKYVESMVDIDEDLDNPEPYFEYGKMDELLYIHNNSEKSFINYLAQNIAQKLDLNAEEIATELLIYPNIKGTSGYIDHAFYSAVMMMRWNGILIEKSKLPQSLFDIDTVDAATAVLLHNYYKRPLQKAHALLPLAAKQHPLAFMIILCDELQEWDRTAYGKENKSKPIAETCEIFLSENKMTIHYGISIIQDADGAAKAYAQKRIKTLKKLINLEDIFAEIDSEFITAEVLHERHADSVQAIGDMSPRPLLEDLEAIAKIIHENYCKKHPDLPQGTLAWEECDDHFRYDNISQARHLYEFVTKRGYIVLDNGNMLGLNKVNALDESIIEEFAVAEHDRWVKSKANDGWCYGVVRDNDKKLHPQMIPYKELSEEEKVKDRMPLIEFIETLNAVDKSIYETGGNLYA